MAWVRIDDQFAQHPKARRAGPLAMAMQIAGLCYCGQYLTDGRVPRDIVPSLLNLDGLGMRLWQGELAGGGQDASWELIVEDLVAAGMWKERKNGSYFIHDYLKYNPSRREVLAKREHISEVRRQAGQMSGEARASVESVPNKRGNKKATKTNPVPVPLDQRSSLDETSLNSIVPSSNKDRTSRKAPTAASCQDKFLTTPKANEQVAALVDMAVRVEGIPPARVNSGGLAGVVKAHGHGREVFDALRAYTQNHAVGQLHEYMMGALRNARNAEARRTTGGSGKRWVEGALNPPGAGDFAASVISPEEAAQRIKPRAARPSPRDGPGTPPGG